jgi:N-acyl-D-aspartate/D-glutamate deacylase
MAGFDLMRKGGTVATAADTCTFDVGIRDGRIAALAQNLARNFGSGAAGGP